jgi:hypothetical protein
MTTAEINRRDLLRKGLGGTALGAAALAVPGLARHGRIEPRRQRTMARTLAALLAAGSLVGNAGAAPAEVQREPMRWHAQSGNPHLSLVGEEATAQLVRTANGVSFSITTVGLIPGHAYTAWVVILNNPAACAASPCTPQDVFFNAATQAQVTYGTGHVVGSSGRAGFGGSIRRGPIAEGWFADRGLDDPFAAEVHLVLNDHGPALAEFLPEMIQTYRAGCTTESLPAFFPATAKADGTPGPNTCRLRQVAIFQ